MIKGSRKGITDKKPRKKMKPREISKFEQKLDAQKESLKTYINKIDTFVDVNKIKRRTII